MDKKECNNCNETLPLTNFRSKIWKTKKYYENKCKKCTYINNKNKLVESKITDPNKYKRTMDKKKLSDNKRYVNKQKSIRIQQNTYYRKNKDIISSKRKIYRKQNPDKVKHWKNKYRDSIEGKISMNLRRRVRYEIGSGKDWLELLGCSYNHLKKWFEYNFNEDKHLGFTWENYGTVWTIDHVKPCKSFDMNNQQHIQQCFNWMNTLPVKKKYNQEKNGKIIYRDIIKLNERIVKFLEICENEIFQDYQIIINSYNELVKMF